MVTICSHTIVKNGQPFINIVLRQVIPHVTRSLITISEKSNDGTLAQLKRLEKEFPDKVRLDFENVKSPGELTGIRQRQLDNTIEDWVLFLDDDDYWPEANLKEMIKYLDADVDGYGVNPYQVIDSTHYDGSWGNKYFTKFFRKQTGVHYRHPWPRDLIYKNEEMLYWKKNSRVPIVPVKFFHLSHIKNHSFRDESWAGVFKEAVGKPIKFEPHEQRQVWDLLRRV